MDYESAFKLAADQELTCSDCKYCQINMKKPNVRLAYYCMEPDNRQPGYYQSDWMTVKSDFLCNKFDLYEVED